MIYRVNQSAPRFCVGLNLNGCGGQPLAKGDFYMIVRRLGPGVLVREPGIWDEGCGRFSTARQVSWTRLPNRHQVPGLEVNANGQVCSWDNKILRANPAVGAVTSSVQQPRRDGAVRGRRPGVVKNAQSVPAEMLCCRRRARPARGGDVMYAYKGLQCWSRALRRSRTTRRR
jgi:hypothetical protein